MDSQTDVNNVKATINTRLLLLLRCNSWYSILHATWLLCSGVRKAVTDLGGPRSRSSYEKKTQLCWTHVVFYLVDLLLGPQGRALKSSVISNGHHISERLYFLQPYLKVPKPVRRDSQCSSCLSQRVPVCTWAADKAAKGGFVAILPLSKKTQCGCLSSTRAWRTSPLLPHSSLPLSQVCVRAVGTVSDQ